MPRTSDSEPVIVRRVPDGDGHTLDVEVRYDRRLRRNAHWTITGTTIRVRAPIGITPRALDTVLDQIIEQVLAYRARARKLNDSDLERRAREINETYFDGELSWHTIRWTKNARYRLGSVTDGGIGDGDIRISEEIKFWPPWVIDYVIAHELAHRKHPNHSPEFWAYLARYPLMERARGFIEGVRFAEGTSLGKLTRRPRG